MYSCEIFENNSHGYFISQFFICSDTTAAISVTAFLLHLSFHSLSWSIHYFTSYTWQRPVNNSFCNNFSIRGIHLTTIMSCYLLFLNTLVAIRGAGTNADKSSVLVQLIYLVTISVRCTIVLAIFKSFSFRDCSSDSYFIACSL